MNFQTLWLHGDVQGGDEMGPYAAVILASPLEQSSLNIKGIAWPVVPAREYQTTVTTIVRGKLMASFFNVTVLPEGPHFAKLHYDPATRPMLSARKIYVGCECLQPATLKQLTIESLQGCLHEMSVTQIRDQCNDEACVSIAFA